MYSQFLKAFLDFSFVTLGEALANQVPMPIMFNPNIVLTYYLLMFTGADRIRVRALAADQAVGLKSCGTFSAHRPGTLEYCRRQALCRYSRRTRRATS